MASSWRICCDSAGWETLVASAAALNEQIAAVEAAVKEKAAALTEKPSVYYVMGIGEYGNWTSGEGSFINSVIEMAGGVYADIPVDQAITEGNLVSAPAWPAHPAWLAQFLALLGTRITH